MVARAVGRYLLWRSGIGAWAGLACAALCAATLSGARHGVGTERVDAPGALHQAMLDRIELGEVDDAAGVAVCFAPGTSDTVMSAFAEAIARQTVDRFQQNGRWNGGAAMGSTGSENQPITLTYSFAPDGTVIPSGTGEASGVSNLFAWLNGIYGSTQTWQDHFHAMFDRWEQLAGVRFVHETNDDGAAFFGNPGQLGVRGDIRIGAKFIDGGGSLLAYAQYPTSGEIVFDSGDSFYNVTTNNSRRLRNVASHELGHAIGMRHVCPVLTQKLMEPIASTAYDGPLHDDIRNAQDYYGDIFEPNENTVSAKLLGTVDVGTIFQPSSIPSPAVASSSVMSLNEKDASPFTNDEDWYRFGISGKCEMTITVSPTGSTYQDNPQQCAGQTHDCCSGVFTDSLRMADLSVQLLDSSGSFLLATGASNGIGEAEQITRTVSQAETFYLRVFTPTNSFFKPQMYTIIIQASPPPEPGPFSLVSPANGSTDVETGPLLDWTSSVNASSYLVEVDTDVSLATPDVSQIVDASATSLDLPDGTLPADVQHFWRVTATNINGNTVSSPTLAGFRTATEPECGCPGDIDGDCDTDIFDFAIFTSHFGQSVVPDTNGDLDGDGVVDVIDFGIFASDFNCFDPMP